MSLIIMNGFFDSYPGAVYSLRELYPVKKERHLVCGVSLAGGCAGILSPQRIDNSEQFSVPYVYCISTTAYVLSRWTRAGVGGRGGVGYRTGGYRREKGCRSTGTDLLLR